MKRVLDERRVIVLAGRGESRFQPVSARNIAELIAAAGRQPGSRVLNAADPDCPSVLEIARAIAEHTNHEWLEVLMPDGAAGTVGDHPWHTKGQFVLDMSRAQREIGYRPHAAYAVGVGETVDWLVEETRRRDWCEVIRDHQRFEGLFDYGAEDTYIRNAVTP